MKLSLRYIRSPASKSLGTCASSGCDCVGRARLDSGPPCARSSVVFKDDLKEGVNGVNRLATKGEKILLTTDKTRKKLPTSDKKIN